MKYLITGATGFVGRHLVDALETRPMVTSRRTSKARKKFGDSVADVIQWNPADGPLPIRDEHEIDVVVNLIGESIATRWTRARKVRFFTSRIVSTRNLVSGLSELKRPPSVLINSSAVGFYGDRGDQVIDENDSPQETTSTDAPQSNSASLAAEAQSIAALSCGEFLIRLCQCWEEEASAAALSGIRVALLRTGVVLGKGGGAFPPMLRATQWALGARLGSGKQYFPWIHIDDVVRLIQFVAENSISGPVNATAPNPVTNQHLTQSLASCARRPAWLVAPRALVRLAAGEFADSLFCSQRVVPRVATDAGFRFEFSQLEAALADLVGEKN